VNRVIALAALAACKAQPAGVAAQRVAAAPPGAYRTVAD
jgi:hypothetical protein